MDNKTKKIITEKWLSSFTELTAYNQNKFYKIIGSFICGIELIKLPRSQDYRPHFVIYPLYKKNVKLCLEYPALMFEFYNSKNLQLDLSYDDINNKLEDALNVVSNSLLISLENNVSICSFYKLLEDIQKKEVIYHSHSGKFASLLELKFYATLYFGNQSQIENVICQIKQESKSWNMSIFETWYGKFDIWLKELQENACNREDFLKQIVVNKMDKKILLLKNVDFTA